MSTLEAIQKIEAASLPAELFPVPGDDASDKFRYLAKLCHPDPITDPPLKKRAEAAFAKLSGFYASLSDPVPASMIGKWEVVKPLTKGGLCDLYVVRHAGTDAILKIARNPKDNDLLDRELRSIKKLYADLRGDKFKRYVPSLPQCFEADDRRVNVVSQAEGCYPLTQLRDWFPSGIPFRHVVWMMNRVLSLLGFAHQNGVIHGAILPHHLLYRPSDHGLVVIDWTASVAFPDPAGHIPYRVSRWKDFYPVEIGLKGCFCATDIYMAAKTMRYAADSIPKRFRALFEWCEAESASHRPESAWALHDRWKELAEAEYGPPTFVPMNLPIN